MNDPTPSDGSEESIEAVVEDTVDPDPEPTTRREALELELEDRGRSDEGAEVEITEVVDDP